MPTDWPEPEALLPHRGPMVLLERILRHDDASTTARVVPGQRRWLAAPDGSAPAWIALELMAQCVAAHEALLALEQGHPRVRGLLVAARGLRLHRERLDPDAVLQVRARRLRGRPGLGAFAHACELGVEVGGAGVECVAEGTLSVALAPSGGSRRGETPA